MKSSSSAWSTLAERRNSNRLACCRLPGQWSRGPNYGISTAAHNIQGIHSAPAFAPPPPARASTHPMQSLRRWASSSCGVLHYGQVGMS